MPTPRECAAREENWDSYGSEKTTEAAVATAEKTWDWSPLPDGGLMGELLVGEDEITITISPDGRIAGVAWDRN